MSLSEELSYLSATEIAGMVRRRQLSSREVVQAVLDRIGERNPSLNSVVYLDGEHALQAADAADRAVADGSELGLLHGVPTAIKDLFDFYPGWPATMGGIRALAEYSVPARCGWAERAEAAGAVLVGKTNSPVLGFRGACDNPLFGASRNPFDTTRNTGGSSGGGAAAVADGLLPFAEGTDAGGSVRIPAAWCGVVGYKQSFGRLPVLMRPNAFGATSPFVFEGVLTRTIDDTALWLSAMAGFDARDPFSISSAGEDFLGATRRSVRGLRIGWSPDFGGFPVDSRIRELVGTAVKAFEQAGAHVEEVDYRLPCDQHELSDLWCRLIAPLSTDLFAGLKANDGIDVLGNHPDDVPQAVREWMTVADRQTSAERAADQIMRTEFADSLLPVFDRFDLLVTPTLACMPVENAETPGETVGPSTIEGMDVDELIGWCLTYPVNFTGNPAVSLPAGLIDGLPVGMQVIGRRLDDVTVLAAAAAFERLRPWHDSYERCRSRDLAAGGSREPSET